MSNYLTTDTDLTAVANAIRTKGGTSAQLEFPNGFVSAIQNIPNSYSQSDEGKVVSNGALVSQTSDTVTENGTVDTTLINSLTVNVSGGGGSSYTLEINNVTSTTDKWNSVALPNNMSTGGALEVEFVMSSQTSLPNIISIGTNLTNLGNWSTTNAIHIFQRTTLDGFAIRQNSVTTEWTGIDPSVSHTIKIDKDYVYIDGVQAVATTNNVKNATTLTVGSVQGNNRFTGTFSYIRFG